MGAAVRLLEASAFVPARPTHSHAHHAHSTSHHHHGSLHARQHRRRAVTPAIAFDIDGVLIRGGTVLEAAKSAVDSLVDKHTREFLVPVAFMTNGGGVLEETMAQILSKWLNAKVTEEMICLSHTPMKALAKDLGDKNVLVAGIKADTKDFARAYGFPKMISLEEYIRKFESLDPFVYHRPQPRHADLPSIDAVFVFRDPPNWYQAIQVIVDIARSNGIPGQLSPTGKQIVPIYFSNPDFLWAADFSWPRFGQGAFRRALEVLYEDMTGQKLLYTQFGKPTSSTYQYTEKLLRNQAKKLGYDRISRIYGIGDNPHADIKGANDAGDHWSSVLVRTGVFSSPAENDPHHPADHVHDHVEHAVSGILHRHRDDE